MGLKNALDDRQTQSRAAIRTVAGSVHPIEPLTQPRQVFGRNAGPVVVLRVCRARAHCPFYDANRARTVSDASAHGRPAATSFSICAARASAARRRASRR